MMLVAQWVGIGLIYGLDALIALNKTYSDVWIPSSWLLVGSMVFATICGVFYKGPYKRLHAEHGHGQPHIVTVAHTQVHPVV
jgi:ABC-type multidrug transport system permease subunit